MVRRTDKHGSKQSVLPSKPKRTDNKATEITKSELFLQWRKERLEINKPRRNAGGETVNWSAFGGDRDRLASPIGQKLKVRITRKRHKRFSQL